MSGRPARAILIVEIMQSSHSLGALRFAEVVAASSPSGRVLDAALRNLIGEAKAAGEIGASVDEEVADLRGQRGQLVGRQSLEVVGALDRREQTHTTSTPIDPWTSQSRGSAHATGARPRGLG